MECRFLSTIRKSEVLIVIFFVDHTIVLVQVCNVTTHLFLVHFRITNLFLELVQIRGYQLLFYFSLSVPLFIIRSVPYILHLLQVLPLF